MGDGWSLVEKEILKREIIRAEPWLNEFFGPPVASFADFKIEKKTPEEAARLTKETGWGYGQFPGWTDCQEGTGTCVVTLENIPTGNTVDETIFDHELANAWLGAASTDNPFTRIINYDKSTEPKYNILPLAHVFMPDQLTFLAQDFIKNRVDGTAISSTDPFFDKLLKADPTFLAKLRGELEKEPTASDRLTWQEAIDLINKASPVAAEIFKRGRP